MKQVPDVRSLVLDTEESGLVSSDREEIPCLRGLWHQWRLSAMGRMVPTGRDLPLHNCGELRLEFWGYHPGWFWAKSAEAAENKRVDFFHDAK